MNTSSRRLRGDERRALGVRPIGSAGRGAVVLLLLLLGACANAPTQRSGIAERLVIDDLVDAYVQIEPPLRTTLQVSEDLAASAPALVGALVARGYGVQRVQSDAGARLVQWRLDADTERPGRIRGRLDVGPVTLERNYAGQGAARVPVSAMQVAGSRAPLALDDDEFGELAPGISVARYTVVDAPLDTPLISLVTDDVVAGVTRRATGRADTSGPASRAVNSARIEVNNRALADSAFGGLRGTLEEVARETVVFPNDSMRLGTDGKRQIAAFVQGYRQNTDMIGLIGCSNGPTALSIGNEGLALGRSGRVSDELVALGIDRAKILDEGCWSERSMGARFPGRGVVIELLRRQI